MSPQIVSELKVVAKRFTLLHSQVEMMRGSVIWIIERFPACDSQIAEMPVSKCAECADSLSNIGSRAQHDVYIENRFGTKARNSSAAHVLNRND